MSNGLFITFEGCDGVGKSTQIRYLQEYLADRTKEVLLIREPGGNEISEKIRNIILDGKNSAMSDKCEALLYFAARAQLLEEVICPALDAGKTIICDRFIDSSIAYQGYARGLGVDFISSLIDLTCGNVMPDATIFIDLPPENAFRSKPNSADRIEKEGLNFQKKVYEGFKTAAKLYPDRIISVKPCQRREDTFAKILEALKSNGTI